LAIRIIVSMVATFGFVNATFAHELPSRTKLSDEYLAAQAQINALPDCPNPSKSMLQVGATYETLSVAPTDRMPEGCKVQAFTAWYMRATLYDQVDWAIVQGNVARGFPELHATLVDWPSQEDFNQYWPKGDQMYCQNDAGIGEAEHVVHGYPSLHGKYIAGYPNFNCVRKAQPEFGSVEATKKINWNGAVADQNFKAELQLNASNGYSEIRYAADNETVRWDNVPVGAATMVELNTGNTWTVEITNNGNIAVEVGKVAHVNVINTHVPPPPSNERSEISR
jgi:hypothetical protein